MQSLLSVLIVLALIAVAVVLAAGLASFVAGGEFNRKYANKLMRLRVLTQGVAIALLLTSLLLRHLTR